jgi:hypothetical protein
MSMKAPRARMTGAVYLLYFVTAVLAQVFLGQKLIVVGDAVNLISYGLYIVLTLLFYAMFKPVNKNLSALAAAFSLMGCIVGVLDVFHLAPAGINPLLFFGLYCLLIGYLIFSSTFLPSLLGWLLMFAGLGWLIFLLPAVARHLSVFIEILGILAEASLMLWLLVKGVNIQRWNEQESHS